MKSLLLTVAIIASVSAGVIAARAEATTNKPAQNALTVADQSNKPADLETVKMIRQELVNDNALSTSAKNIAVIVVNNGVTLKGDVSSNAERELILKHVYSAAPKYKIYNQISITK